MGISTRRFYSLSLQIWSIYHSRPWVNPQIMGPVCPLHLLGCVRRSMNPLCRLQTIIICELYCWDRSISDRPLILHYTITQSISCIRFRHGSIWYQIWELYTGWIRSIQVPEYSRMYKYKFDQHGWSLCKIYDKCTVQCNGTGGSKCVRCRSCTESNFVCWYLCRVCDERRSHCFWSCDMQFHSNRPYKSDQIRLYHLCFAGKFFEWILYRRKSERTNQLRIRVSCISSR